MSTLRVNNLQDVLGTGQPAMPGAAKAWVNFNGTGTVAIRAAFNVTSITDNGTGNYTANFTNAFSSGNYAAVLTARRNATNDVIFVAPLGAVNGTAFNTGSFQLITFNQTPAREDAETVSAAFFL